MTSQTYILMSCTFAVLMPFMKSMLSLGLTLVVLAIMSALTLTSTSGSWFGFIMFLIYITGLLVLFGYMLVVSPNSVGASKSFNMTALLSFLLMIVMMPWAKPTLETKSYNNSFSTKVVEIYENPNLPIYLFMVCLLFVALILAVYLSYKTPKPMRSFL